MATCHGASVGRMIYQTSQALRNYVEKQLKPYDLTAEQMHLLKNISTSIGVVQSQLSEIVGKTPANVTRILDRLERKNYVERRGNPQDRRSTLVYLTERGEEMVGELTSRFSTMEMTITAGIDGPQQQLLKDILGQIGRNIELACGEPVTPKKRE